LADAAGIEARYWDIHGNVHETSPDTMRALLRALGIAAGTDSDIAVSLETHSEERWRTPLPPVIVAQEDLEIDVPLCLPVEGGATTLQWSVQLETGEIRTGEGPLDLLQTEAVGQCGGASIALRRLKLAPLPIGYHTLTLSAPGEASARLVVAPTRCYLPPKFSDQRCWGVSAQLYALRSSEDWGIGDFGHLQALVGGLASRGADVVGVNPLHALFLDMPDDASPYSPSSRLFRNSLYLDVTAVPGFAQSDEAGALIEGPVAAQAIQTARGATFVDYKNVAALKLGVLECLFRSFDKRGAEHKAAFNAFVDRAGDDLDRFATFQMLSEHLGTHDWSHWPTPCRDQQSRLVANLRSRHADRVTFFKYLQWLCDEQLSATADLARQRGMSVGLYNDLAVSVAASSADHWSHQDLFAGGARIGSPPDPFNEKGQEWGVVPLKPARLRATGFGHFTTLLRANMRHTGALRIDHVMGWQRQFLIPAGALPAEGAYVRFPLDELLSIAALESQRNRCLLIGEDLGTVPAGFRERMAAADVLSCRVFYFERDHNGFRRPHDYPRLASVSAATHDLATLHGYWSLDDVAAKSHLGLFKSPDEELAARRGRADDKRQLLQALADVALLPTGMTPADADRLAWTPRLAQAVQAYLARASSLLFMAQLDDLAGETHQTNLPGSTVQYPNWRRRMARTLKYLLTDPAIQEEMKAIAVERAK
jgi:4-alpha-glucanotransferase